MSMTGLTVPGAATTSDAAPGPTTQPAPAPADGAAPAPAPPVAAPHQPVSKALAAQLRREKALQADRAAIKAEKAAIAAERAELARLGAKPANPVEALQRFGMSYKDATDYVMTDGQPPTAEQIAKQANDRVEALERQREEDKKASASAESARINEYIESTKLQAKSDIAAFVDAKPDDYEFIRLNNAQETVFAVIEQHFLQTSKLLSLKEAADLVEAHIEQQVAAQTATKKWQARGRPPGPESEKRPPASPAESRDQVSAQRRTLSSDLTSSTPTLAQSPRVEEDRMARALAALTRKP